MRRHAVLACALVALALVSLAGAQSERATTSAPRPQTREAAPPAPDVQPVDAEGLKKLLQRDGPQPRPLLVNFWATWCDPCRDEFPDLVQLDKDYKTRGLEFITVSLDDVGEVKTVVPQFLSEMRATMPAYLLNVPDPEPVIKFVDPAWGGALPATFLFDARGQVVFKRMGRIKLAELRAAIDKVTGGK